MKIKPLRTLEELRSVVVIFTLDDKQVTKVLKKNTTFLELHKIGMKAFDGVEPKVVQILS